jgi:hypothetical protein
MRVVIDDAAISYVESLVEKVNDKVLRDRHALRISTGSIQVLVMTYD